MLHEKNQIQSSMNFVPVWAIRTFCMKGMKELHKAHELWHCLIYKGLCNTFYC